MHLDDAQVEEFLTVTGFPVPELLEIEVFHERTKLFPSTASMLSTRIADYLASERGVIERGTNRLRFPLAHCVDLPEPKLPLAGVGPALFARRSCREFASKLMSMQALSDLLSPLRVGRSLPVQTAEPVPVAKYHSSHMRDAERTEVPMNIGLRAYPSAGALYPIETYIVALRVEGLQSSIWHYDPWRHALEEVHEELDFAQAARAFGSGRAYVNSASLIAIHTVLFERSAVKYGFRSYRFCLHEAGSIAMCLSLTAATLGLADLQFGGALDDLVNDLIGADGVRETVVASSFIGAALDP